MYLYNDLIVFCDINFSCVISIMHILSNFFPGDTSVLELRYGNMCAIFALSYIPCRPNFIFTANFIFSSFGRHALISVPFSILYFHSPFFWCQIYFYTQIHNGCSGGFVWASDYFGNLCRLVVSMVYIILFIVFNFVLLIGSNESIIEVIFSANSHFVDTCWFILPPSF